MRGHIPIVAALLCALSGGASAQASSRIFAADRPACISVANLTTFNWPVTIQRNDNGTRSTVGVKPREVMRYCAPTPLAPNDRIIVTLRSTWVPLGECRLKSGGTMEIRRVPDKNSDSGERTIVKCYEGG
ncbi:MAG TPA: hypothetical protein VF194_14455 [Ferrovibrio sp.]|uniref:hypothetical protein n=1 Tax=Ferrovibrio sp. TaxID=1917215 RepID=UPI002ED18BD5